MTAQILAGSAAELRRDRTSLKWTAHPPDVLPLWVAEMDAAPCEPVVRAVTEAVQRGDTGYPQTGPYAAWLASFADARWGWELDPRTTVQVADVITGIGRLIEVLTEPGGPVVLSGPIYNAFFLVIESVGRRVVDVPLTPRGRLDHEALATTFAELSRAGQRAAYLLCNPHNPTGTVHSADELTRLAALAEEHAVQVVSDEIHGPLVYSTSTFTPYLTVPGGEHGVTVTAASKGWNLAGLKAGLIVPGTAARATVGRLHPFVGYGASHVGVLAQTAAYREGGGWLDRLMTELDSNRRLLQDLMADHLPGVRLTAPESTYLAWLDCRELDLDGDPAHLFLERAGVALSPGPSFGATGAGHVRLNFATSPTVLREAVARMADCLA
jgi:cysteine-S-conjugate beta-lyase